MSPKKIIKMQLIQNYSLNLSKKYLYLNYIDPSGECMSV
jgi:hypothetical protein